MASISAINEAWAPRLSAYRTPRKPQQDAPWSNESAARSPRSTKAHDAVAEKTALAQRRGKCAPSVDTKLANAWLGIYVALTKTSREAATLEAATQASTVAETEESLSEVESPSEFLPQQMTLFGESLEISHSSSPQDAEPLTSTTLPESWADASDGSEEDSPKGRRRRPHRRRRTRRRGRGGKGNVVGADAEETHNPIDEGEHATNERCGPCGVDSPAKEVAVKTPFEQVPACLPFRTPLPNNTCPRAVVSTASPCARPVGMALGTSPKAGHTPQHCDASARTPPRKACPGMAQLSSRPNIFGTPTNLMPSPAHAANHGGHVYPSSGYPQLPASLCAFGGSAGQGQVVASPSVSMGLMHASQHGSPFFPQVCASPLPATPIVSFHMGATLLYQVPPPASPQQISVAPPQVYTTHVSESTIAHTPATQSPQPQHLCMSPMSTIEIASPAVDPLRVWLAGGAQTSDADLMMRLQACIPEMYED